jgi:hypothetical protein
MSITYFSVSHVTFRSIAILFGDLLANLFILLA